MTQSEPDTRYVSISWCTRIVCASPRLLRGWSSLLKTVCVCVCVWTPQCGLTGTVRNCQLWFWFCCLRDISDSIRPLGMFLCDLNNAEETLWLSSPNRFALQSRLMCHLIKSMYENDSSLVFCLTPHTSISITGRVWPLLLWKSIVPPPWAFTVIISAIRNKRHIYTKYCVYFASYIDLSFFSFSWNNTTWDVNDNGYTVIQDKRKPDIQYKTMKVHIPVNIRETKAQ